MSKNIILVVKSADKRSTVSIDAYLHRLLVLRLGHPKRASKLIREWAKEPEFSGSRYIQRKILDKIADPSLFVDNPITVLDSIAIEEAEQFLEEAS